MLFFLFILLLCVSGSIEGWVFTYFGLVLRADDGVATALARDRPKPTLNSKSRQVEKSEQIPTMRPPYPQKAAEVSGFYHADETLIQICASIE